jgi:ATP-dependent Clp protease ATP-binding subunit ClpC
MVPEQGPISSRQPGGSFPSLSICEAVRSRSQSEEESRLNIQREAKIDLPRCRRLCVFERYTLASRAAVFCARYEASLVGSPIIDTEHLLLGLLRVDPSTMQAVADLLSLDSVRKAGTRWHEPATRTSTSVDLPLGPETKQAMFTAALIADGYSSSVIRSEHHLMALIGLTGAHAAIILEEAGASRSRLEEIVRGLPKDQEQPGDPAWRDIRNELLG